MADRTEATVVALKEIMAAACILHATLRRKMGHTPTADKAIHQIQAALPAAWFEWDNRLSKDPKRSPIPRPDWG